MDEEKKPGPWWPIRTDELQAALGVMGFATTVLAFTGAEPRVLAWGSLGFAVIFYLAGLLVRAREAASGLKLIRDGALSGTGHLSAFRSVRRALLLMHLDDDPPSPELLALYRRLLDRGVEIRRIVFLRPDAAPNAYSWLVEFGDHDRLQHRVVLPDDTLPVHFSFAVVDTSTLLLSVPGWEPVDGTAYSTHLVLRHLLIINDPQVVAVFASMHETMWDRALPLRSVQDLDKREALFRTSRGE